MNRIFNYKSRLIKYISILLLWNIIFFGWMFLVHATIWSFPKNLSTTKLSWDKLSSSEWNELADAANNTLVAVSSNTSFTWDWNQSTPLAIADDWIWSNHLDQNDSYQMAWLWVAWTINATSFIYSSDRNLKKNIETVEWALSSVLSLRWVSFDWKDSWNTDIWLIAQEVEWVLPDTVVEIESSWNKAVKYGNLVAVLIEAIKELTIKNNDQTKLIDDLQSRIELLENK
jgi:hypothetical protein